MIEINRERSDAKIESAKLAIRKLMEDGERVSIRREIDMAIEQQAGKVDPRRSILLYNTHFCIPLKPEQTRDYILIS